MAEKKEEENETITLQITGADDLTHLLRMTDQYLKQNGIAANEFVYRLQQQVKAQGKKDPDKK